MHSTPFSPSAGSTVSIQGTVTSLADIYFNGDLDGSIEAPQGTVTLGIEARIKGDIKARRIVVNGVVCGDLMAVEQIALTKTSRMEGNLSTGSISIQEGAHVTGEIDMLKSGVAKSIENPPTLEKRFSAAASA